TLHFLFSISFSLLSPFSIFSQNLVLGKWVHVEEGDNLHRRPRGHVGHQVNRPSTPRAPSSAAAQTTTPSTTHDSPRSPPLPSLFRCVSTGVAVSPAT
ncbi:hypothetical protein Dimus_029260, partial [Dionaea muscipula]